MRLAVVALLVAAACGPAATRAPAATAASTPTHHPPTATPGPINVDDMMGGSFSPATVFAVVGNEIAAVKLQNHHVPYRIGVAGTPQALVGADGRLYVVDRTDARTRIRAFDPTTGVEMATTALEEQAASGTALAQDRADRLLLLVNAGAGVRVEAIQAWPLTPLGGISKAECGDRLLASESRIAVVCSSRGRIQIDSLAGEVFRIDVPGAPIVGATMLADGTTVVGTVAGALYRVMTGAKTYLGGPQVRGGSIVPDAIAAADAQRFVVLTRSGDAGTAGTYDARSGLPQTEFRVSIRGDRALALWPFAYYVGERGLWHVDLRTGLAERMITLDDPVPLGVSAR